MAISGTFNGWTGDSFLPFDSAAFGGYHLLVLSSKGLLAAAGSGARGQLGNLSVLERRTMVPVSIPDVIRPAWLAESSLNTVLDSDGELTVRWPAAQDNREVAGYRIRLRRSDGQIEEQDAGDQLTWTFSALSAELAYEIQVWAYDSDSVKASPTQLSNLVTYILPEKAGRDAKVADYFSVWEKSVWQIDNLPHNWHLDPQGLLRPLEVPWDVSSIYAEAALPQTDNWHGLRLSAWGAALLLAAALLLMLRQRSVRRQALIRFTAVLPMNAGR
ncbi:MAG TPA: hypothetical protein DD640_03345 [Clostridiales bacterium]|nr:hypothetical protein [Clostridiales bacterium]